VKEGKKGKTRKKRGAGLNLNKEQELKILEWVRGEPILYDMGHDDYFNAVKKNGKYMDFAPTVGLTGGCKHCRFVMATAIYYRIQFAYLSFQMFMCLNPLFQLFF
jgi:hypothetical protein